ncbi:hypothetical protein GCM10009078_13130 [Cupriavidus gilardii]
MLSWGMPVGKRLDIGVPLRGRAGAENRHSSKRGRRPPAAPVRTPLRTARPKKKRRSEPAQLSTTEKEEKSGTAREVSHPSRASNGGKRYLFL